MDYTCIMYVRRIKLLKERTEYLDHLDLSSINFPSLLLLSSTKRRQICSTFVKYTLTSSLLYWQSRQRKGLSDFSLWNTNKQKKISNYWIKSSKEKCKKLTRSSHLTAIQFSKEHHISFNAFFILLTRLILKFYRNTFLLLQDNQACKKNKGGWQKKVQVK